MSSTETCSKPNTIMINHAYFLSSFQTSNQLKTTCSLPFFSILVPTHNNPYLFEMSRTIKIIKWVEMVGTEGVMIYVV